jgi:hypothetical protein
MPGRKEVVPVGPAARPNWLVGLIARLDAAVRHEAKSLPVGEIGADQLLNLTLAREILVTGTREKQPAVRREPLDRVEPFLENVARPRDDIAQLPRAKIVASGGAVAVAARLEPLPVSRLFLGVAIAIPKSHLSTEALH